MWDLEWNGFLTVGLDQLQRSKAKADSRFLASFVPSFFQGFQISWKPVSLRTHSLYFIFILTKLFVTTLPYDCAWWFQINKSFLSGVRWSEGEGLFSIVWQEVILWSEIKLQKHHITFFFLLKIFREHYQWNFLLKPLHKCPDLKNISIELNGYLYSFLHGVGNQCRVLSNGTCIEGTFFFNLSLRNTNFTCTEAKFMHPILIQWLDAQIYNTTD